MTSRTRKKTDMMGPMSAAADRLNLSCRSFAMVGVTDSKSMEKKVVDTNCLVTTAWRPENQEEKTVGRPNQRLFRCP